MLFSLPFLPPGVLQIVSRILLHSLWQGLLLAVVAAAVVVCTRHSRPAVRYNLLLLTWVLFLVCVAGTAVREITVSDQPAAATTVFSSAKTSINPFSGAGQKVLTGLDKYAGYIFTGWFVFFLCKLIYLLAGLGYVRHIRQASISAPPVEWQQKLQELAAQLHIRRRVVLLQSALARVPLVTGIIKPVILLPAGLLTQLPPDQVEAILLHELAHVRRQDYLVNLIQQIAEAVFFFNPGLLWVSRLIKDERENCCDELALDQLPDRRQLIHALVAFQEYHLAGYPPAPAFPGRPPHLLSRVQRMISRRNSLLSKWEFRTLAVCLVLLLLTLTSLVVPDISKEKIQTISTIAAAQSSSFEETTIAPVAATEQKTHTSEQRTPAEQPPATGTTTTTTTTTTITTTTTTIIDDNERPLNATTGNDGNAAITGPELKPEAGSNKVNITHYYDGSYNNHTYSEDYNRQPYLGNYNIEIKDNKVNQLDSQHKERIKKEIKRTERQAKQLLKKNFHNIAKT